MKEVNVGVLVIIDKKKRHLLFVRPSVTLSDYRETVINRRIFHAKNDPDCWEGEEGSLRLDCWEGGEGSLRLE